MSLHRRPGIGFLSLGLALQGADGSQGKYVSSVCPRRRRMSLLLWYKTKVSGNCWKTTRDVVILHLFLLRIFLLLFLLLRPLYPASFIYNMDRLSADKSACTRELFLAKEWQTLHHWQRYRRETNPQSKEDTCSLPLPSLPKATSAALQKHLRVLGFQTIRSGPTLNHTTT